MIYLLVSLASIAVAGLTFFSGFGLGTLLMPLFALFFPVQVAVAATAVVHLANNVFKAAIIGRQSNKKIVLLFGIPAALAAFGGASLLTWLSHLEALTDYTVSGKTFEIEPVALAIGLLMIFFAVFELSPKLDRFSLSPKWIPVGGVLSGFFGGLSGHQGALRTIFLTRAGLSKEEFVGTIALVAMLVDIVRITVYGTTVFREHFASIGTRGALLVLTASLSAWAGSFIGRRILTKITMRTVRLIIGLLLLGLGLGLASGLV